MRIGSTPRCRDVELLLAAALQRDEPEGCGLDAVAACGQQAVVLMQRGLHALEGFGYVASGVVLHRDGATLFTDDDMILEEGAGILRDRGDRAARGAPCGAIGGVRVAHGDDVGMLHHVRMSVQYWKTMRLVTSADQFANFSKRQFRNHLFQS